MRTTREGLLKKLASYLSQLYFIEKKLQKKKLTKQKRQKLLYQHWYLQMELLPRVAHILDKLNNE